MAVFCRFPLSRTGLQNGQEMSFFPNHVQSGRMGTIHFRFWLVQLALFSLYFSDTNQALYSKEDFVVSLDNSSLPRAVFGSRTAWCVEFYSSSCGTCRAFSPTYIALAHDVKGVIPCFCLVPFCSHLYYFVFLIFLLSLVYCARKHKETKQTRDVHLLGLNSWSWQSAVVTHSGSLIMIVIDWFSGRYDCYTRDNAQVKTQHKQQIL